MYQAGLGMVCIQSILRPSPALLCITEGAVSSRLRFPGSWVNRLLADGRLRGWEERRSQGISPPLCFRNILWWQLHPLHGTSTYWGDPPSLLLPSGVPKALGLCNVASSICLSILGVTVASCHCCSLVNLTLPCLAFSSFSHWYDHFPKLITLL